MEWNELKELPAWMPIHGLPATPARVDDVLFRIAPTQYLICPPYNERFERISGATAFLGSVLWAPNDGAARRAVLMEIEADLQRDESIAGSPPPEMLLPSGATTYGAILEEVKSGRHGRYLEGASFRIGSDGAFVHRSISVSPLTFFFRSREDDDHDRCYAIEFLPPGFQKVS